VAGASLAATIAALEDRLRAVPTDASAAAALGLALVQRARITADPTSYPRAEEALRRSLRLRPEGNVEALLGMGALALARHDFAAGLRWGRRAAAANPGAVAPHGVMGDALVELGRYRAAFREFRRMVGMRPDVSSYARMSYALELRGHVEGALRAMRLALRAAGTPEDAAWVSYQLGELYWNTGRIAAAAAAYRRGAALAPAFVPNRAGLARVAWARGDLRGAIRGYRAVVARMPLPEHVIWLADLLRAGGRVRAAERAEALVRAEEALYRANGVNVDLELALFEADHGSPERALAAARAEWERRKSVHVADAVAWALHANGRDAAAARFSDLALRLGTRNATFLYHAGMIRAALGEERAARVLLGRALRLNRWFSPLHAPMAEEALARLEGGA
jgi:tetratricopeptide (TPR) repeat protein